MGCFTLYHDFIRSPPPPLFRKSEGNGGPLNAASEVVTVSVPLIVFQFRKGELCRHFDLPFFAGEIYFSEERNSKVITRGEGVQILKGMAHCLTIKKPRLCSVLL